MACYLVARHFLNLVTFTASAAAAAFAAATFCIGTAYAFGTAFLLVDDVEHCTSDDQCDDSDHNVIDHSITSFRKWYIPFLAPYQTERSAG